MRNSGTLAAAAVAALALVLPAPAKAHCDGLDGPVVQAARKALETGNVKLALAWVRAGDEAEIHHAFARTLEVRKLGGQARELADTYFLETLVRVHRAGEGAPYTGLKPAGRNLGPALPAADKALADGSGKPLADMLAQAAAQGALERFQRASALRNRDADDVAAGREYVRAYVEYIHYVERLWDAANTPGHGQAHEPAASEDHSEHH